jgi:hypothetical protein
MKFTLRDVLWATAVAALLLGWHLDRRLTIEMFDAYIRTKYNFKHFGGRVPYGSWEVSSDDGVPLFELEADQEVAKKLAALSIKVHEEEGRWVAEMPALQGAMAWGSSRSEAVERVRMVAALICLNRSHVYYPNFVETRSDELFPDVNGSIR